VRAVVLDKLDSRLLLLPQLEVAIDGRRDEEVRAALRGSWGERREPIYSRESRAENRRTV
jgi:hypothetical protein